MSILLKFKKKIASRIKELREEQNLSQQDLARLAKVSRQTIYYLERGISNPSLTLSYKIKDILNKKTVEEIFYNEPIIRGFLGNKTTDELDEVAELTGIDSIKIWNLKKIDDDQLSKSYTEEDLFSIAEAFGLSFEEFFLKDEEEI